MLFSMNRSKDSTLGFFSPHEQWPRPWSCLYNRFDYNGYIEIILSVSKEEPYQPPSIVENNRNLNLNRDCRLTRRTSQAVRLLCFVSIWLDESKSHFEKLTAWINRSGGCPKIGRGFSAFNFSVTPPDSSTTLKVTHVNALRRLPYLLRKCCFLASLGAERTERGEFGSVCFFRLDL